MGIAEIVGSQAVAIRKFVQERHAGGCIGKTLVFERYDDDAIKRRRRSLRIRVTEALDERACLSVRIGHNNIHNCHGVRSGSGGNRVSVHYFYFYDAPTTERHSRAGYKATA